ncbi:hypothetical protein [Streptomyces physcomitrii]|uniref:Lipoprotein n=1 Tax=Streptomyces physcomitrii TaxID=2724184 RepID=A0ABX1GX63_9ACTN|nr:hypothetical protein [Streptomyces physcomitrii]NKI40678.1 hypothetical protein [Streptomyces physcomitrii]
MYRIRVLPAAVSLTAAAALLLTGCGGDDKGKDEDKIEGAGGETKSSAPASPSASGEAPKFDRPKITLPSDVQIDFEEPKLSDPQQAAALGDAQNFIRAIRYGIVKQDPDESAYKFYSDFQSQAQQYAKEQIKARVDAGLTISGEQRYFRTKVIPTKSAKSVVINFCSDSSKYYSKEVKTEKVRRTKPSAEDFAFWEIAMSPSEGKKGLWRAAGVKVTDPSRECRA